MNEKFERIANIFFGLSIYLLIFVAVLGMTNHLGVASRILNSLYFLLFLAAFAYILNIANGADKK